jgi:two-component system, cell cycle response regulator DivK
MERDGSPQLNAAEKATRALTGAREAVTAADLALSRQNQPVVLVIEDDQDNRDLYAHYFTMKGYRVLTAVDGAGGLEIAREALPEVIVLDLGLPILDGWEVARVLRADPTTKDVCIVACSGYATGPDQQRALDAGVTAFVIKPSDPQVLVDAVVSHLKVV